MLINQWKIKDDRNYINIFKIINMNQRKNETLWKNKIKKRMEWKIGMQ